MIQLGSPGVYIVEASSGVRPIATVSTSVAAFIDFFSQGPTDRAVQIFGTTDFERVYGGLHPDSEASYAITQFFLNGGSSAWVARVSGGTADDGTALDTATASNLVIRNQGNSANVLGAAVVNPGDWGNSVRLRVTYNGDSTASSPGTFNLVVTRYDSRDNDAAPMTSERYLDLSIADLARVHETIELGSQLIRLSTPSSAITTTTVDDNPATNGTLGTPVGTTPGAFTTLVGPAGLGAAGNKTFFVSIGSSPQRRARLPTWTTAPASLRELRALVEAAVRNAKPHAAGAPVHDDWDAAFAGATVELVGSQFLVRSNPRAKTYLPSEIVTIAGDGASTADGLLGFDPPELANVQEYSMGASATTAFMPTVSNGIDGDPPAADALIDGLALLDRVDLFNMLCVPRASELSDTQMVAATSACLTYCQGRRAMLFVDVPKSVGNDPVKAQDWLAAHDSFRDKNSIVYFPRFEIPDPKNGFRPRSVGPSGTLAGLFARTDTERGVWKAPAGVDARLRGISRLEYKLTDAENGVLNPLAINCLRNFPIYGSIAWGARTLDGADVAGSEWKYIPIRRLALMIEESLFRGTKWVVFEPNDEPLWARIRQNVGAFMLGLFRQGAFQGTTPKEAFYVKCDGETTTAIDRNLGVVNIQVGFAPLKPAEFVVITIQQIPDIVA